MACDLKKASSDSVEEQERLVWPILTTSIFNTTEHWEWKPHILTFLSSPAEANMHASTGFQATALTAPPIWPLSVSIIVPLSLLKMYTLLSRKCQPGSNLAD